MQHKTEKEFTYKPVFTLWMLFKDRGKITMYSRELKNTIPQIKYRKKNPVIDLRAGINGLVKQFQAKKEKVFKAYIYHNDWQTPDSEGTPVFKFERGKEKNRINEIPMFQSEATLTDVQNQYSEWLYNEIQQATSCWDFSNRGIKAF